MKKIIHIFIAFATILSMAASCQRLLDNPEEDTSGEILIQVKGDGLDIDVDTKTTAVTSIPSTLYWGATRSGSVKWSTTSVTPSSGVIYTGKYQTATPTSYVYYVANQTFTTGGTMTVANNNTDIVVGKTTSSTTRPSVTLDHIFARTGNLTLNVPAGQTKSSVSWQIRGVSSISGTAGTYDMSTGWNSASTRLDDWTTITSSSDMYLIPGTYEVKVSFTLTNSGNSRTYTEVGEVLLLDGKINNITATTTSETLVNIDFTVSVTPWTTATQVENGNAVLTGSANGHGWVDLGCRIGGNKILFADRNVGASNETDYGDYFAWGEVMKRYTSISGSTISGATFEWSNAPYHTTVSIMTGWTKYIPSSKTSYWGGSGSPDNKLVLDPSDDVASVQWGSHWCIPTESELKWLVDNCTWTWQSDYRSTGVSGYVVSGTGPYSSASIFLPAAGFCNDSSRSNAGTRGYYCSSSLASFNPSSAVYIYFYEDNLQKSSLTRSFGFSVRPVYQIKDDPSLPGEFSVSSTKKVKFSRGNLQAVVAEPHSDDDYVYIAKRWKLADYQWSFLGDGNNSPWYENTVVDMFAWAGKDPHSGIDSYGLFPDQDEDENYYIGSDPFLWSPRGWGDIPGVKKALGDCWRVMTKDEADYLLSSRSEASSKYGFGQIGSYDGLILLPDSWSKPSNCTFTSGDGNNNSYVANGAPGTTNAWCDMEAAGAVFLPGAREYSHGEYDSGGMWTGYYLLYDATLLGGGWGPNALCVFNGSANTDYLDWFDHGFVRLVKDVE